MSNLVIFDLGRVLIRICDGWQHACTVAGVPTPVTELSNEAAAALDSAVCAAEVGRIDLDEFARTSAPHLGIPPEHVVTLSNAYLRGPYPGVIELLDELRSLGIQTGCLSNTNANHWRLMNDPAGPNFMPLDRLTHRFASHLIRARKPDDAIYAHVEAETGFRPEQIVFFDDVEENIAAARRRGWQAQRVRTDADPIEQVRQHLRMVGIIR